MPPPSDDDLPDEHELKALYGRLPKAEPDAALDASILAAATRATPVRRRPRWPVALGSAAVLVMAVGVGWHMRDTPIRNPGSEEAARMAAPMPAPEPAPAAAPAAADEVATPAPPPPPPAAAKMAPSSIHAQAVRQHAMARRAAPGAALASKPSLAEPAPAPMTPPAPPAPPAPIEPSTALYSQAPAEAPEAERKELQGVTVAPAAQRALRAAPAPAPANAAAESPLYGFTGNSPAGLAPDDRVGEIRRLLDHGDREEALRKLAELRRLYPAYALPQDLRDLKL